MTMTASRWQKRLVPLALVISTWCGTARGEVRCPDPRTSSEARRLAGRYFAAGQQYYDHGEYSRAFERFECSFRLVPHRDTLFNIARTAEAAGDLELAVEHYDRLLSRYPDDAEIADIEIRVRLLRAQVDDSRQVETPSSAPLEPRIQEVSPTAFGEDDEEPAPNRRASPRGVSTSAWIMMALGVATSIAGGVLVGVASTENEEYLTFRDVGNWSREALLAAHERGLALEYSGWASIGIGAAALVTSLVLFLVSNRRRDLSARRGWNVVAVATR